jgi:hypothetical protein
MRSEQPLTHRAVTGAAEIPLAGIHLHKLCQRSMTLAVSGVNPSPQSHSRRYREAVERSSLIAARGA